MSMLIENKNTYQNLIYNELIKIQYKFEKSFDFNNEWFVNSFNTINSEVEEILLPTNMLYEQLNLLIRNQSAFRISDDNKIDFASDKRIHHLILDKIKRDVNNINECIERIIQNFKSIKKTFKINSNYVNAVSITDCETHNNGGRPIIICFDHNNKVLYKPTCLKIDMIIKKCIRYLFQDNILCEMKYLDFSEKYGFRSYAEHYKLNCNDEHIQKYYYQCGILIAAAYAFLITDLHSENVIATKNGPELIDLEMGFYHFPQSNLDNPSVYDSGLIGDINHSGIQAGGYKNVIKVNQDTNLLGEVYLKYTKPKVIDWNRIYNDNVMISTNVYVNDIIDGFLFGYKEIINNRNKIIKYINYQISKQKIKIRYLIRPTFLYAYRLIETIKPKYTIDADNKLFANLQTILHEDPIICEKINTEIINAEIESLLQYEIPHFWHYVNDKNLYYNNSVVAKNYFSITTSSLLNKRINSMTLNDCLNQVEKIYQSIKKD